MAPTMTEGQRGPFTALTSHNRCRDVKGPAPRVWTGSGPSALLLGYLTRLPPVSRPVLDPLDRVVGRSGGQRRKLRAGAVDDQGLPRRWVVEGSLSWITQARRHTRDYERLVQHSEALITWAAITLMTRRITQEKNPSPATLTKAA